MIRKFIEGYNVCIMLFGATGDGQQDGRLHFQWHRHTNRISDGVWWHQLPTI